MGINASSKLWAFSSRTAGSGLVDFPSEMNGRHVLLCWRLGEPEVQFWHEVDAGYAGRQPLSPELVG